MINLSKFKKDNFHWHTINTYIKKKQQKLFF